MKLEQMYEGAPWCLGRYDSFEIDKPQLITLLGHDYVVWKDKKGKLSAIDNICPHAGANLAKGGYIVEIESKDCLACPYHGNKVQFFGDGKVVVDGKISQKPIQTVLPLQIIDGLVWTYGLRWRRAASPLGEEKDGKLVASAISPKLPIPDYTHVPYLPPSCSEIKLESLNHIYSRAESIDCNLAHTVWNLHDGEHFAGTHRETMLSKEIEIKHLTQDEHKLSWQLIQYKRDDPAVKKNEMNLLVDKVLEQSFNVYLPSFAAITLNFNGRLVLGIVTMYPESPTRTRFCLDSYIDFEFAWWQKLIKLPQKVNVFRDRLIGEDTAILENLYTTFEKKISLKNDTPAQLAMNYLQNWNNRV